MMGRVRIVGGSDANVIETLDVGRRQGVDEPGKVVVEKDGQSENNIY